MIEYILNHTLMSFPIQRRSDIIICWWYRKKMKSCIHIFCYFFCENFWNWSCFNLCSVFHFFNTFPVGIMLRIRWMIMFCTKNFYSIFILSEFSFTILYNTCEVLNFIFNISATVYITIICNVFFSTFWHNILRHVNYFECYRIFNNTNMLYWANPSFILAEIGLLNFIHASLNFSVC